MSEQREDVVVILSSRMLKIRLAVSALLLECEMIIREDVLGSAGEAELAGLIHEVREAMKVVDAG